MRDIATESLWEQVRGQTRRLLEDAERCAGSATESAVESLLMRISGRLGPVQREHVIAHGRLVAACAERIGRSLGLGPQRISQLRIAGLLHDIGKCAMPEQMLAAARPLAAEEREIMDTHAAIGAAVAARLGAPAPVQEAVRDHHTTFADGGLTWARPGTLGRIIAVADALVAMTSARAYAPPRPMAEAIIELRACSGGQFDPVVVGAVACLAPASAAAA
ncbi:MAG: HD-GYP domain-containing protein [Phycisphaerales bacterium JB039]